MDAAAQVLPKEEAEQLLAQAGDMGRDQVVSVVVQSAPGGGSSPDSYGSGALVRLLSFRVPSPLPPLCSGSPSHPRAAPPRQRPCAHRCMSSWALVLLSCVASCLGVLRADVCFPDLPPHAYMSSPDLGPDEHIAVTGGRCFGGALGRALEYLRTLGPCTPPPAGRGLCAGRGLWAPADGNAEAPTTLSGPLRGPSRVLMKAWDTSAEAGTEIGQCAVLCRTQ